MFYSKCKLILGGILMFHGRRIFKYYVYKYLLSYCYYLEIQAWQNFFQSSNIRLDSGKSFATQPLKLGLFYYLNFSIHLFIYQKYQWYL